MQPGSKRDLIVQLPAPGLCLSIQAGTHCHAYGKAHADAHAHKSHVPECSPHGNTQGNSKGSQPQGQLGLLIVVAGHQFQFFFK